MITENHDSIMVVGLNQTNGARVCSNHPDGCGKYLAVGDFVTFKDSFYRDKNGEAQPCCKCSRLNKKNLSEVGCTVGMLSSVFVGSDDYGDRVGVVRRLCKSDREKRVRHVSVSLLYISLI